MLVGPRSDGLGDDETSPEQPGLELRQRRRLQPAVVRRRSTSGESDSTQAGSTSTSTRWQPNAMMLLAGDDDRVVERHLPDGRTADLEGVGTPPRADLQHLAKLRFAGQRPAHGARQGRRGRGRRGRAKPAARSPRDAGGDPRSRAPDPSTSPRNARPAGGCEARSPTARGASRSCRSKVDEPLDRLGDRPQSRHGRKQRQRPDSCTGSHRAPALERQRFLRR